MKKIVFPIVLLIFFFLSGAFVYAQNTYYIASNGNDGNNGLSEGNAIKTISHLNTINLSPGDKVLFRKGDVFVGQVAVKTSGTAGAPISYGAYGTGNDPVISGAINITPATGSTANVYEASTTQVIKGFYINGTKAPLARQPNSGFFTIEAGSKKSLTDGAHLNKATDYFKNANVRIRSSNYTFEARTINSSGSNTINWTQDLYYNVNAGWGYYLDNHKDFLDAQNEWYYDDISDKLFIYSQNSLSNCHASVYDYGAKFSDNISNIVIDGLSFKYQHHDGINLYGTSQNITITNCNFEQIERHGISFTGTYNNITITGNIFQQVYGTGIMSNSISNAELSHNTFTDIGMWQGYGAVFGFPINNNTGFSINGSNNHVHHNIVKNTGYNGIRVDGEGNITEKNFVQNACLKLNDGGGIYFWGAGTQNSTFRYNIIDNVVGNSEGAKSGLIIASLYFDNGSNNITAENNVMVNSSNMGVLVNRGTESHILKNNLILGFAETGVVFADNTSMTRSVNNTFSGNILATTPIDAYFVTKSTTNSVDDYDPGTFTNNTYFNPYDPIGFKSSKSGSGTVHRQFSLKGWSDYINDDKTSENLYLGWNTYETTATSGNNLIQNSSFDSGTGNWSKWTNGSSSLTHLSNSGLDGGALNLELTSTGDNDITFAINVLSSGLVKDQWYELSFDALGSKNGNVKVIPKRHYGAYDNIGKSRTLPIYPSATSHSFTFQADEAIDPARVDFQIDKNDGVLTLDNVSLQPVTVEYRNPSSRVKYFYNASDDANNISLPAGNFFKLDGTQVSGSVQLTAWSGIVLYTNDNVTLNNNADLSTLSTSEGSLSPAFDAATLSYTVTLPAGATNIPTISATAADANATVEIIQATNISGNETERTATVTVTAEDGTTQKIYKITFAVELSANADLDDLSSSEGSLSPDFQTTTTSYSVNLPAGTTTVPTVSATAADANATVAISQASNLMGTETERTATVTVTAEDGTTTKTYSVVFFVLPEEGKDATLKLLTTSEGTIEPAFAPGIQNYSIKLPAGEIIIPSITAETNDPNASVEITEATNLEGTLFERTTTITVTAADGVTQMVYSIIFDNESEVVEVVLNPHNQFSPNGDLIDDFWMIENIHQVPTYEVIVFNQVGQEVFRSKNYQNNWNGTSEGRQLLPTTYYFVIRDEKGENVKSGSVNLIR